MKRRTLSLVLACALSVALLSACGSKGNDSSVSGSASGSLLPGGSSSVSADISHPDGSAPDQSEPDASAPDGSQPGDASQEPAAAGSLSLNKNSFTLSKAGATYRLKYTLSPEGGKVTFSSSDEKVATVNGKGTVTAVAPGSAVITVSSGDLTAQCTVKCSWTASKPAESKPAESKPAGSTQPSSPSQSTQDKLPAQEEKAVDLAAFFTKIEKDYDMSSMEAADGELIENCYPGLSAIQTQQLAVYMCMMNPSPNGDVVLVQVKDSKDVDAVKAILQARIQYMVGDGNGPGGAWYPEPTEMWENNSRIVTHGNYVMMVADFECDNIVNAFNALF